MDRQPNSITPKALYARLGTKAAPIVADVRDDAELAVSEVLLAGAVRHPPERIAEWLPPDREVVTCCADGTGPGQKAAAALRLKGVQARFLEGGLAGWTKLGLPTRRNIGSSPGKWVTRERPKIDRIACPWLARRFVDPLAEFIYVPKEQVLTAAQRLGATPYDIDG